MPVTIISLGFLTGLNQLDNGLPLKVVLILSAMPVGFIAMVPPTLVCHFLAFGQPILPLI